MLDSEKDILDGLRTYIDGKMKRYSLLFSVNGGAFAIAKFLQEGEIVLGKLTIRGLAIGAVIFTLVMTVDIWKWGEMMRRDFLREKAFTIWGKGILLVLCVLLISGWALAAM